MNKAFEARLRHGARLLVLSLACLLALLLISWSAVGISKAAAWMPPHPPPASRVDLQAVPAYCGRTALAWHPICNEAE